MKRHTGIICTLGPASSSEAMIAKMASRGMNIARINFSHGDHSQNGTLIDMVRKVNKKHKYDIKILLDLEGFRIRVGHFKQKIELKVGDIVYMSNKKGYKGGIIPFDYTGNVRSIKKNKDVYMDDGNLHLKVTGHKKDILKLKVIQGGILRQRKGINIPDLKLRANILTNKDKQDIDFGIKSDVDYIAQSFVRNKNDILRVAKKVQKALPQCKLIAKIESREGVRNIDNIIDSCDAIMIARGDLGVSLPIYKIPIIQKYLIRRCIRKKKYTITATQMLESMVDHGRPTRAEVSDVANAVLDETDFVMLSAETAVGKYPSRSVEMMRQIIHYTETYEDLKV